MRYNFTPHHDEPSSLATTRLYKHIRSLKRDYKPQSRFATQIKMHTAMKPKLRLVK